MSDEKVLETCNEAKKLFEIINGKQDACCDVIDRMKEDLLTLRHTLDKVDGNGVPMCYTPREWKQFFEQIEKAITILTNPLQKVAFSQGQMVELIKKLEALIVSEMITSERWKSLIEQLREGVNVKTCQDCPFKGDTKDVLLSMERSFTEVVKPQIAETHKFVLKWKYAILPAFVGILGAIFTGIMKILELWVKSGNQSP